MSGWISLHRKIADNPLWTSEPFTRAQAWVDMLLIANHKDGYIFVRGNKIDIKRGQIGWSLERLKDRWQWSRGKVSRFLNELETVQQIVQQKNRVTSIITIVNYETYQESGQQTVQQTGDRQYNRRVTNNNVNNENKERGLSSFFSKHPKYPESDITENTIVSGKYGIGLTANQKKSLIWEMCQHISPKITKANARSYFIKLTNRDFQSHDGDDMTMRVLYDDLQTHHQRKWFNEATENETPEGMSV